MHKAKTFFFVCAGAFLLALAYHLGARSATAQTGNEIVAIAGATEGNLAYWKAVTATGDTYTSSGHSGTWVPGPSIFGAPTPVQDESWGQLKQRYNDPAPEGK